MANDMLITRLQRQIEADAAMIAEILSKGNDAELRKDTGGTLKIISVTKTVMSSHKTF